MLSMLSMQLSDQTFKDFFKTALFEILKCWDPRDVTKKCPCSPYHRINEEPKEQQ